MNEFDFFQYYALLSNDDVVLSYKGPVTDVLLSEFSKDLRQKLIDDDPRTAKKVFAIFMEMATNVLYYSKEKNIFSTNEKVGTIVITRTLEKYTLMTGNLIYTGSAEGLLYKCQTINSLDRESLREYKRNLRNEDNSEESKGAGIGLVQIALTADNPVKIALKALNEQYSFFIVSIDLSL